MASYYYLISSLPSLRTDAPMPMSYDAFLEQCRDSVNDNVYSVLSKMTLSSDKGPLLSKWGKFYQQMMRELSKRRREKLGKPFSREVEADQATRDCIERVMSADNPLTAEKLMLDAQFAYLDSLVAMHYFDDYVLYGYAVKLKLLERRDVFEKDKGSAEFERLFSDVQQKIMSI